MNTLFKQALAVSLAIFSSTAAMGQSDSLNADGTAITITKNGRVEFNKLTEKKWFQELQSRIKQGKPGTHSNALYVGETRPHHSRRKRHLSQDTQIPYAKTSRIRGNLHRFTIHN